MEKPCSCTPPPRRSSGLLKPCPRCQSGNIRSTLQDTRSNDRRAFCADCGFCGPVADGLREAIAAWNSQEGVEAQ